MSDDVKLIIFFLAICLGTCLVVAGLKGTAV